MGSVAQASPRPSTAGSGCFFKTEASNALLLAPLRDFAAFWLVIPRASLFVFLLLLGVQGLALHLLPHALFVRWSSFIQTAAFFAVLTGSANPALAVLARRALAGFAVVTRGAGYQTRINDALRAAMQLGYPPARCQQ